MITVLGDLLPLAVGIAISPVPVIAVIVLLLSPQAGATSTGFLLGWLAGIVTDVVIFTAVAELIPRAEPQASQPILAAVELLIGLVLVALAVRHWRTRPAVGEEPPPPRWLAAVDTMTPGRGAGLGFVLSAVNPKNLLLALAAGTVIGAATLSPGATVAAVMVFTLVAGCSVAVPVIAYRAAKSAIREPLQRLRGWLVHNSSTVMAVLLFVLGVTVLGRGIGDF